MIKTLLFFAYLLVLALLGFCMLVGAVAGLLRLFRRLGSMLDIEVRAGQNSPDLKRLGTAQESTQGVRKRWSPRRVSHKSSKIVR